VAAAKAKADALAKSAVQKYTYTKPDPRAIPILTPTLKGRKVMKFVLANRIQVYLVSDPNLLTSAAALCVEAGSWQDPDEALGMAHFVEHMTFMGTARHPKPGFFDDYLAANGAQMSNAETSSQHTDYAFACPHKKFLQALSYFSEFFTEPLFSSSGADKERHAVDSEFEMHKDDDSYRMYFVEKFLASRKHPFQRFSIGSLKTLGHVNHAMLAAWVRKHYSANLMHIAVYTGLDPGAVRDDIMSHFSAVPDRNYTRPLVPQPMLDKDTEAKIVHLQTIKRLRSLTMKWEIPPMFDHAPLLRPDRLLSSVLGDEGEGSVLSLLRKKHWALSLSAGMGGEGRDNPTFEVAITLTDKGQSLWDQVVKLVFEAIRRLQLDGIPNYIFDQIKLKDTHSFQFQWRTSDAFNSAMGAASAMVKESLTTFPRVSSVIQDFDAKACQALLRFLVPERMHLLSMGGVPAPQGGFPRREPYYGAQFAIEAIPETVIQDWQGSGTSSEITAPKPNMYIPGVSPGSQLRPSAINPNGPVFPELPQPDLVLNETFGTLYHRQDDSFGDPWLSASFRIRTHKKFVETMGAEALVLVSLFVSCAIEHIKTASYPFVTAGLSAGLSLGKGPY